MTRRFLIPSVLDHEIGLFNQLRHDISHLLDDAWRHIKPQSLLRQDALILVPDLDFAETDDAFIVTVELPGLKQEDIHIDLNNTLLTIRGEKKIERDDKKQNYHRIERTSGAFSRTLQMRAAINPDAIEATFNEGVLMITLPKAEEAKNKTTRIEIKSKA